MKLTKKIIKEAIKEAFMTDGGVDQDLIDAIIRIGSKLTSTGYNIEDAGAEGMDKIALANHLHKISQELNRLIESIE